MPEISSPPPEAWRRDPHVARGPLVQILVDGLPLEAHDGEPLIVALGAAGCLAMRRSPKAGTPRGAFCLMGSCQECLVHVDGAPVEACMELVRSGMRVELDRLARDLRKLSER